MLNSEIIMRAPLDKDLSRISEFRKLIEGGNPNFLRPPEFYHWKYFQNPVESCVRLAEDNGQIVGLVASTFRKMQVEGKSIYCAELGDLFVHPNYRGKGIFTALANDVCVEVEKRGVGIIYVRPNENSFPILTSRLGFKEVFRLKSFYYILNWENILGVKFRNFPRAFFKLNRAIAIKKRQKILKGPQFIGEGETVLVEDYDFSSDELNNLLKEVSKNYDVMIMRDKQYLDWRYIRSTVNFTIYVMRRNKEFLGYIVLTENEKNPNNLRLGYIVDLISKPCQSGVAEALINRAILHFEERQVDAITTWIIWDKLAKDEETYQYLKKSGFFGWGKPLHFVIRNLVSNTCMLHQKWLFRIGDLDGI